jgi:hypothetical protein
MISVRSILMLAAACGVISSTAQAGIVFSDNFNSYAGQTNWVPPANWVAPPPGTVDLIGETTSGTSFDYFPGNGGFVDLNGSNGVAGTLQTITSFAAGTYTVSFDLGGNTVGPSYGDNASKTTKITLGTWGTQITLAYNAPLTLYSYSFTTTGGPLTFAMASETPPFPNEYIGNILDNVRVATAPEPSTWAMLLLGFMGIGFTAYRRKRSGSHLRIA